MMHDRGVLWLLMVLSCLALVGLGFSGILLSRAARIRIKLEARMAAVSVPHTRNAKLLASAFTRAAPKHNRSALGMSASLFGFDPSKPEQYPLRWWLILLLTMALTKVVQVLEEGVIGQISYLTMPVIWLMISRAVFGWAEQRRKSALLGQFPDTLSMIVRSVRVGIPVLEAMRAVSRELPEPTGPEFTRLIDQVTIGVAIDEAVMEMARRCGIPEYRFFATALSLQNQTGGGLSETLEGLADVIRKRVALAAKGKALASEARTSAGVLTALPIVTGVGMYFINPKYISMLFDDPTGHTLLAFGVLSLCTGVGTIRTIIRKSLS